MKKMLRKILAVVVVFSVVLSVGIIAMQSGTMADDGIYYQNDFSGALDAENWSNATNMTVENGALKITKTSYLDLASAENLSNYVVEAKVTMDDSARTVNSPTAGIIVGTNNQNKGYEFALMRIYAASTGKLNGSYVRLYNRINTSAQPSGNTDMLKNQVEPNVQYALKLVALENKLDCYVNGVLVKTFEGITATGGAGFNVNGCTAYIDDFIVRKPTAAEAGQEETSSEAASNTSSAAEDVYFFEDFNDTDAFANSGWQVNNENTALDANRVVNGTYKLGGKGLSPIYYDLRGNAALEGVLDYTIQADVRVDTTTDINGKSLCFAGITGRAVKGTGIELCLVFRADGTGYVRLYDRAGKVYFGDELLNNQVQGNQIYTLKLVCVGNVAKGYVDGVLVAEGTITSNRATQGVPSMKSQDCFDSYIDNYLVRKPTQQEIADSLDNVSSDVSSTTSSEVSSTTSSATSSTTSSSTSSTTSSATSSTTSSSTSSTTSGSVVTPDGYYLYEPFENDSQFATSGWVNGPTANRLVAGNGGLVYAKSTATATAVLRDNATLKALTDYAVEADVMVDTTVAVTTKDSIAGLIGRYSGSNGVELCLYFNTQTGANYVRLHDRKGGTVFADKMLPDELQGNTFYKLKMVFIGDTVCCYVDGEFLLAKTIATTTAGTVGFRSSGYPAYFDNLAVRPVSEAEKAVLAPPQMPQANANGVYYATDFEDISILQDTNWATPITNIENGCALLESGTRSNTIGNADFSLLTDYVVESTIIFDPESTATLSRPTISINGRLNQGGSGYELGLMGSQDGTSHWVRLYDRVAGAELAVVPVQAERGKAYTLRLVMIGNTVRGYFGNEKVIEIENATLTQGGAGYKANGIDGFIENYIIRKPTAAEIRGESGSNAAVNGGNDKTPNTGDSVMALITVLMVLLVAAAALLLCKPKFTHK